MGFKNRNNNAPWSNRGNNNTDNSNTAGGGGGGGTTMERLCLLLGGFMIGCVVSFVWGKRQRHEQARQLLRQKFRPYGTKNGEKDDEDEDGEKDGTKFRGSLILDDEEDDDESRELLEYPEDFLTGMMSQLWEYFNPTASRLIRQSLESTLGAYNLKILKVDLGSTPLHVDNVVVHPVRRRNDDGGAVLQWGMDVIWDGSCEISLNSPLGPLGVAAIKLQGRLVFWMKPLTSESIACFRAMTMAFVNAPAMDLEFTGLAQVAELSVLQRTVRQTIQDTVGAILVLPNRMVATQMAETTWWHMYEHPLGLLQVTLWKGYGFQIERRVLGLDDVPDVYVEVQVGNRSVKSRTIFDSLEPHWGPEGEVLRVGACWHEQQVVTLRAWDEDSGPLDPDDDLGAAQRTVREFQERQAEHHDLRLLDPEQPQQHCATGAFITVSCELLPLVPPSKSNVATRTLTNTSTPQAYGLLTLFLIQAFDVPLDREKAATFVKAIIHYKDEKSHKKEQNEAGEDSFVTRTIRQEPYNDALEPLYDVHFPIHLTRPLDSIVLTMMQESSPSSSANSATASTRGVNDILGSTRITMTDLLQAPNGNFYRDHCPLDADLDNAEMDASKSPEMDASKSATSKMTSKAAANTPKSTTGPLPSLTFGIMLRVVEEEEEEEGGTSNGNGNEKESHRIVTTSNHKTKGRGLVLPTVPVKKQRPPLVEQYCRENRRRLYRQFRRQVAESTPTPTDGTAVTMTTSTRTLLQQTRRFRLSILSGEGFPVVQGLFTTEFPNVFCHVQWVVEVSDEKDGENDPATTTTTTTTTTREEWKTSTLYNSTAPHWNESKDFVLRMDKNGSGKDHLILSAYNENDQEPNGETNVLLGRAKVAVESILLPASKSTTIGTTTETTTVELDNQQDGTGGAKITLQLALVK